MLTESFDVTFKDNLLSDNSLKDIKKLGTVVTQISQYAMIKREDSSGNIVESPEIVTLLGVVFPNNMGYKGPIQFFPNDEMIFLGMSRDEVQEDESDDEDDSDEEYDEDTMYDNSDEEEDNLI